MSFPVSGFTRPEEPDHAPGLSFTRRFANRCIRIDNALAGHEVCGFRLNAKSRRLSDNANLEEKYRHYGTEMSYNDDLL